MRKKWLCLMMAAAIGGGVIDAQGQVRRPGGGRPGGQGGGQKQPGEDKDTYTQAMEAIAAKRVEAGIRLLEMFLNSSAGDPRMDKALKTLRDARQSLAKDFVAAGREIEASEIYLALAEDAEKLKESKDGYLKQAMTTLQTALADAQKRRAFDKALEIEKAWKKEFPEKPGLLSPEEMEATRMDAVLSAADDKFNQLTLPDIIEHHYPDGQVPWEQLAKRNKGIPVMGMYFRALAEVGWAGRYIAEYQRLEADSPVRSEKTFAAQTERMFLRRCEASMMLGNVAEARTALNAARSEVTSPAGLASLKAMESKMPPDVSDTLGGKPDARKLRDLSFTAPITGKKTWSDKGEGFGEAKDVWLDDGADVTVSPGVVLNGGTITLKRAKLKLAGTANQPVIFRNVHFNGELGALVQAENAVLENCTFSKTGGFYNMHSSRWEFSESVLYHCRFSGLSQIDYGVQMTNCAWVEGTMPQRKVEMTKDLAAAFNSRWDSMESSLFLRSKVAISVFWTTKNCNFVRCSSGSEDFVSKTSLAVPLYMPEGDPAGWKLREWTVEGDVGEVQFGFSRKAFDVKVPAVLWGLLPVELGDKVRGQRGQFGRGQSGN